MLKSVVATAVLMVAIANPATAEEAFDPGVPAPKAGSDYYAGADKVVFHVSVDKDEKGYLGILGNVNNYIKALAQTGMTTDAVVVMNGDGLGLLRKAGEIEMDVNAKLPGRISELKEEGVRFLVCYNTLRGRKIKFEELYDAKPEDVIPSGVAEVGRLEAQGYRMLKP